MATGGDSEDSGQKNICNICEEGDLSVTADYFCVSCEQYLCDKCKRFHSRIKASRSHQVIGTDEIPSLSSLTLGSEAIETSMCTKHERKFEYFCVKHMTILCPTCKLIEHKTCTNITELQNAANNVFSEGHCKDILKGMEELLDGFRENKDKIQNSKDVMYESKQLETDKAQQTIMTAKRHLDKLGAAACKEINSAFAGELKRADDKIHISDVSIVQLKKWKAKLERAMEVGDTESQFVTVNYVSKEMKQHCNSLKDIVQDTTDTNVEYKVNDNINNVDKLLPNLGTVSVTKSPQPETENVLIYTGELRPRTTTDTKDPFITSYEMLPDGKQLITDDQNNKLKLYDSNNQYLSELSLPDCPSSVVVLSKTEAVTYLQNISSLQYITIGTDLSLSQTKKLKYQPLTMVKYGDDILAALRDKYWKVVVIDKCGNVKRTLYQYSESLLNMVFYIGYIRGPFYIAHSVDQKTVYVVDEVKGCIGLTMGGDIVFQDERLYFYSGLAVGRDCLFIGVKQDKKRNVRRLSLRGEYVEDLDLGNSYPLKIVDSHLIICHIDDKGESLIKFFNLL